MRLLVVIAFVFISTLPLWAAPFDRGGKDDAAVNARIHAMLAHPLSVDEAVQIALLRNPDLQALYEDIGVAQADIVQAGLLKNPVFEGYVRWPSEGGGRPLNTNTSAAISMDFLDLVLQPARRKLAQAEFRQVSMRVSDAVTHQTQEVKEACYNLQGHLQILAMQRDIAQAAAAAADLAARQNAAGNLNEVDLARQQATALEAHNDVVRFEAQVAADRFALARQLGLLGSAEASLDWNVVAALPELPPADPPLARLLDTAMAQRQDVAAARVETDVLSQRISLSRRSALGSVNLGVSSERDGDGFRVTGPTLAVGIPLFDRNQGAVQRLEAELRRARHHLTAVSQDVERAVRTENARMSAERTLATTYREHLLPLRRRILALSFEQYNGMVLGVYALLQARQEEIMAHREYLEIVRSYWTARAALERAVGGRLPAAGEGATP